MFLRLSRSCTCSQFSNPIPSVFFFFNDTATTEIYTLSLHDALPISLIHAEMAAAAGWLSFERFMELALYAPGLGYYSAGDRKSTRLNSSHVRISYAVFCLKKKTIRKTKAVTAIARIMFHRYFIFLPS